MDNIFIDSSIKHVSQMLKINISKGSINLRNIHKSGIQLYFYNDVSSKDKVL